MAEEVAKQQIKPTSGTFTFVGILSNFDKNQKVDGVTRKNNAMRTLVFNVDTAEGHSHRLQLRAYQTENVYFSKTEVDKDGNRHTDTQQVKWNDRQKFNLEGYNPIDRVSYHYGTITDDKGERRATFSKLTFDAIPDILAEFKVGDSVRVVGNIEIEDYTSANGNSGTAVRLIPTRIFHTTEDVDFKSEKFTETANFSQKLLVDEVEKTGTDEMTVTGLIIGNQRIGRQDFIFRGDAYKTYMNLPNAFKTTPKYISMTVKGTLTNAINKEEAEVEYVEVFGMKVPKVRERETGNSFVREFVVKTVVTGEDGEAVCMGTEYTEADVQEFINTFIRARQEFGDKNTTNTESTDADDFAF